MRHSSKLLTGLLAVATHALSGHALAADAQPVIEGYATDSSGAPVRGSDSSCWRSSRWIPGETMPPGCAAAGVSDAAAAPAAGESSAARDAGGAGRGGWHWPFVFGASGASGLDRAAPAAGGAPSGIPGYLSDSRGTVVRSGFGECWRTGSWSPADATVVGCDGVLGTAVPVPAPAPAAKQAPSTPPDSSRVAPQAATPSPTPDTGARAAAPTTPTPPSQPPASAAPVTPTVPSPPSAPAPQLAPDQAADGRGVRSEKVTLDTDTYFDFDKASLKPEGRRKLEELASRLYGMQLEVVVATGHTDAIGTRKYNQGLSMRRAQAVKDFLEQQGLPVSKIFTTGKGETEPVASNRSRDGRARNRRVEVEVVGKRERP